MKTKFLIYLSLIFPLISGFFHSFQLLQAAPQDTSIRTPHASQLIIQDDKGQQLQRLILCPQGRFGIRYIHSVALSPVEDWFYISDRTIFLEKTIYQDFGAGLPHHPASGQTMYQADGQIIIDGFKQALPRLELRVGRVAHHTLLLPRLGMDVPADGYEEIPLMDLARPGSTVVLLASPPGTR